jgi:hypothetical protein
MISKGLKAMGNYSREEFLQICIDVLASKIGNQIETLNKTDVIREILNDTHSKIQKNGIDLIIPEVNVCQTQESI